MTMNAGKTLWFENRLVSKGQKIYDPVPAKSNHV